MEKVEIAIVGGSYAGLSAALSLGRSLRNVLVIDAGEPCNRQTPHSQNFLTQDGMKPQKITATALEQLNQYDTVKFWKDTVVSMKSRSQSGTEFVLKTSSGLMVMAKKVVFATGLRDVMPDIRGLKECWGISVIHCPYCHGYEARAKITGILAYGEDAMHYVPMVRNLTNQLTVYSNGESKLSQEQVMHLRNIGVELDERIITALHHEKGYLQSVVFVDGSSKQLEAMYTRLPLEQKTRIPGDLGCEISDHGFIVVDPFQQTNVPGIYACGDNTTQMRSVASAVYSGNLTGAVINKELCEEEFGMQ